MSEIYINVADQELTITEAPLVSAGGVKENYVNFTFSSEWSGFTKIAVFHHSTDPDTKYQSVCNAAGRALVPHEVTAKKGTLYISVNGILGDVILTSEIVKYRIVDGEYLDSEPSSPEIYEQFIESVNMVNETVQSAEETVQEAVDAMNAARAITEKRFIQTFNISSSTSSVTFAPTDYVYTAGDRFEVYINGLKLTDSEFTTSGATITFATAISGSAEVVEVVCYKDITDARDQVDATLSISGMAADAKVTGDKINDLKSDIEELQQSGGGLTADIKTALLNCFENVVWKDDDPTGRTYINALEDALYAVTAITLNTTSISLQSIGTTSQLTATTTPEGGRVTWSSSNTSVATVSSTGLVTSVAYGSATITATAGSVSATCSVLVAQATCTGITATYTQSGTVYDGDSLDVLTSDLTVTASWSNGTTSTLTDADYTLSGTLEEGTSTITVSYGGYTDTFNVTVSEDTRGVVETTWTQGALGSSGAITQDSAGSYYTDYIPITQGQTISFYNRDSEWTAKYKEEDGVAKGWVTCVFYKLNSSQAYAYIYPRLSTSDDVATYSFECTSTYSEAVAVRISVSNMSDATVRDNMVVKVV